MSIWVFLFALSFVYSVLFDLSIAESTFFSFCCLTSFTLTPLDEWSRSIEVEMRVREWEMRNIRLSLDWEPAMRIHRPG